MSSSAVRDITKCIPSNAISRPAAQPRVVEWNSRRARRVRMRTDTTPAMAAEIRQANSGEVVTMCPRTSMWFSASW
jgi:hypothetical protein